MKYKVHGFGRKEISVTVNVAGEEIVVKREAIEVEFVPSADYARSFTYVFLTKGPEDAAAIVARFPVDAEFEIAPASIA